VPASILQMLVPWEKKQEQQQGRPDAASAVAGDERVWEQRKRVSVRAQPLEEGGSCAEMLEVEHESEPALRQSSGGSETRTYVVKSGRERAMRSYADAASSSLLPSDGNQPAQPRG
jgi:hypothetical protein